MTRKIKVGQLGTGHMHAYKMKTLRQLIGDFEILGVAEDDPKLRDIALKSDAFQGLPFMSTDELLALPDLEAVLVETEEHDLVAAAQRCIGAGKHIHLDKPGGDALPPFKELLTKAEKKGLIVQLGYMYRNNLAIQYCIKAAKDGLLGNIFTVDAVMSRYDGEDFRQIIKTFNAGAAYIFLCHLIDLVVILLGKPDHVIPLSRCTRDDGVVDNGFAVLQYPNGCNAIVRTPIVEVGGFNRRYLAVYGDKGTLVVQPLEIEGNKSGGKVFLTTLNNADGKAYHLEEISQPPLKDRYEDQLLEFARIVRGEIANPYPYSHELLVQQVFLEACGL